MSNAMRMVGHVAVVLMLVSSGACADRTLSSTALDDDVTPSGNDDFDGDGVANSQDNCPTAKNPGQEDSDGDSVGDACDDCPTVADTEQTDADSDGRGDACQDLCDAGA